MKEMGKTNKEKIKEKPTATATLTESPHILLLGTQVREYESQSSSKPIDGNPRLFPSIRIGISKQIDRNEWVEGNPGGHVF